MLTVERDMTKEKKKSYDGIVDEFPKERRQKSVSILSDLMGSNRVFEIKYMFFFKKKLS